MTKTAAIAIARSRCAIYGRGTSWTVSGPYYHNQPAGPTAENHCSSYSRAVAIRTAWRASIAISLLIGPDAHAEYEARCAIDEAMRETHGPRTLAALINIGLAERHAS